MPAFDFVPIKLRSLPRDMSIDCKIYSAKSTEQEGGREFSLLCENQIITQELDEKIQRSIFPGSQVYLPRKYVIEVLFAQGYSLGFTEHEITEIRNFKSPWESKRNKRISVDAPPLANRNIKSERPESKEGQAKIFQDRFRAQKFREAKKKYDKTKAITEDLLKNAAESGKIDKVKGEGIARDVQQQVSRTDSSIIIRTINQIRTVDEYLHTHCLNVAFLNGLMGKWLEFTPERQSELVECGLFHDLGKLGLDKNLMQKSAPYSPEEFEEMKRHPVIALEMLMKSGVRNNAILEGVIQHHERSNGTGYPKGLVAKDICEYARITAISDTYDAMVTKRVHSESHSPFVILHEFEQGSYSELDFSYVNVFISCMIEELKGKEIIMNDGREAVVLFVNPSRLLYPIVEIAGEVITTDEELYCVRMKNILE